MFLEGGKNISFTVNNRKLTFPEFPALHFKFDVLFVVVVVEITVSS